MDSIKTIADAITCSGYTINTNFDGSTSFILNGNPGSITIADNSTTVNTLTKKPEVPTETTTKLVVNNGKINVKHYKDGYYTGTNFVISDIKDVKTCNNVVFVTFADGTTTKAVLNPEDKFDFEYGISVCITKKLLGQDGSAIYNKLIKRALKVEEQNYNNKIKAEAEKAAVKKRKEKADAKRKNRKIKQREEQINMYKEAIVRAYKDIKED